MVIKGHMNTINSLSRVISSQRHALTIRILIPLLAWSASTLVCSGSFPNQFIYISHPQSFLGRLGVKACDHYQQSVM